MEFDLCKVQHKIPCLFKTVILQESSNKHKNQAFKVVASEILSEEAQQGLKCSMATEKLDGTSCFIQDFQGVPWLWARRDCRPSKAAEKRFRKFQNQINEKKHDGESPNFHWNISQDFKDIPEEWIPCEKVNRDGSGNLVPDNNGHIPGWIPIDSTTRTHCWHLTAVNLLQSQALVLRPYNERKLIITLQSLSELRGRTMELIGTHVNGNPYKVGSKRHPVHILVEHGIFPAALNTTAVELEALKQWFGTSSGQVEGIVWHCQNGELFKFHRHHVNLPWPVHIPYLSTLSVLIDVPNIYSSEDTNDKYLISQLSNLGRVYCNNLTEIDGLLESYLGPDK